MTPGAATNGHALRTRTSELLRFATAGSVDDGKSTLIGRLLHDSKAILEDQLEHVIRTSERRGDGYVNLALLMDGLRAEREQGITIDVAYRYFQTPRRASTSTIPSSAVEAPVTMLRVYWTCPGASAS